MLIVWRFSYSGKNDVIRIHLVVPPIGLVCAYNLREIVVDVVLYYAALLSVGG